MASTASKRTQITIETNRVLIIRRMRFSRAWCQECRCEVDVVGLGEASVLTGMAQPVLRERVDTGKWHFSESTEGALLICLNSLLEEVD